MSNRTDSHHKRMTQVVAAIAMLIVATATAAPPDIYGGSVHVGNFPVSGQYSTITQTTAANSAALGGLSNGIAVKTGTGTWTARSIATSGDGISVSNGSGVSGNPTLSLSTTLANLSGVSTAGLAAHTGSGSWAARSVAVSGSGLSVSNGSGASGNPTLSLAGSLALVGGLDVNEGWAGNERIAYYKLGVGDVPEAAFADITSFGRSLLNSAAASNARTTLGLGTAAVLNTAAWSVSVTPSVTDTVSLGTLTHAWAAVRTYELDVLRDARVTGTLTMAGRLYVADGGSGSTPGITWGTNVGFERSGNVIYMTANEARRWQLGMADFMPLNGARALGSATVAGSQFTALRLTEAGVVTAGHSSATQLLALVSGAAQLGTASVPGSAPGGFTSGTSRWVDRAAPTAVGYSEWIVGETSLTTDTDGAVAYIPIHLTPGAAITAVRARFQGGTTLDGVGVQLVKRVEGSGSATAWTDVGTEAVDVGESVAVVTQTLGAAETITEGTAYAIRVRAQIEGTTAELFGVGVQTSARAL